MIKKFVVEERLSQYPQPEFEYQGKTYKTSPLSINLVNKLMEIDRDLKEAENKKAVSPEILFRQMKLIIPGLPSKIVGDLDIRIVLDFVDYVLDFCNNPDNFISAELKKKINIGEARPS